MPWHDQLKGDSLAWLLEYPSPDIRYRALRDLLDRPADDPQLAAAYRAAATGGPIAAVLDEMQPEGYWARSGPGYNPKYRASGWSVTLLAQLGASIEMDGRIAQACQYLFEHALTPLGQFSTNGLPSGTIDCLQGNLCWALTVLGVADPRLEQAFEWMARTVTGEGLAPVGTRSEPLRYYTYKSGPLFSCSANNYQPCAWGAAKAMLAFSVLPAARRTPLIERAIQAGIDFLFSVDLLTAAYPTRLGDDKPNRDWWKFGFPVFYITDLLQIADALVGLGCAADPRLAALLDYIRQKQDEQGRWPLEYDYSGKTWYEFGEKKQPNPWVTLRALRVLKMASR